MAGNRAGDEPADQEILSLMHAEYVDAAEIRVAIRSPAARVWYNVYEKIARTRGSTPQLRDFDPAVITRYSDVLVLLRRTPGGEFYYLWYGSGIEAWSGLNLVGHLTSEFDSDIFRYFDHTYRIALSRMEPILTVNSAPLSSKVAFYERLVLPLESPDGTDEILAVNCPRLLRADLALDLLDDMPCPVLGIIPRQGRDAGDGRVMYANQAAMDLFGLVAGFTEGWGSEVLPGLAQSQVWGAIVSRHEADATALHFDRVSLAGSQDTWTRRAFFKPDIVTLLFIASGNSADRQ